MHLGGNKLLIQQHLSRTRPGGATLNIVPIDLTSVRHLLTFGKGSRLFLTGIYLPTGRRISRFSMIKYCQHPTSYSFLLVGCPECPETGP